MKKSFIIAVFMGILLLFCGCEAKQISFCVVQNTEENISSGDHSGYVKLISIDTDSNHAEEINAAISKKFTEAYDLEGMPEYLYGAYDESTVNGRLFIPGRMSLEKLLAYNAERYK